MRDMMGTHFGFFGVIIDFIMSLQNQLIYLLFSQFLKHSSHLAAALFSLSLSSFLYGRGLVLRTRPSTIQNAFDPQISSSSEKRRFSARDMFFFSIETRGVFF